MEIFDIHEDMPIFIKKGPEIFDTDVPRKQLEKLKDDIKEKPELGNDLEIRKIAHTMYQMSKAKGAIDYSGCSSFFVVDRTSDTTGAEITIEQAELNPLKYSFENIDKLYEKFIDLKEFLAEAEYVGRFFKRTKPMEKDISFMQEDNRTLVLFATESNMLIVRDLALIGKKEYAMLSPRYFEDGNYAFYGEQNIEYNDRREVFKAIENQLTKERINRL